MKRHLRTIRRWSLHWGAALLLSSTTVPAMAASNNDPDWPCIQRKVPELSLGQVWNGPELPETAGDWAKDSRISDLVKKVAARRTPIAEAQKEIKAFADTLSADKREPQLMMLARGLFDHLNAERSHVISGIARYAHKQLDLAARLRKEGSDLDALRAKPDADPDEIERRTDQLAWETRLFDERVHSLTAVCEVPTLIEQRLYQLSKTVSDALAEK
jgi:hypothetical protein